MALVVVVQTHFEYLRSLVYPGCGGGLSTDIMYFCLLMTIPKVEVVRSARVPIVKFYHISTGRAVDVSFNMISGIQMGIKVCS